MKNALVDKSLQIEVTAHPNSRHPRIEQDIFGHLDIYISAPAEGGKANTAIIKALSTFFNVTKAHVLLISGEKDKKKIFIVQTP